MLLIATVQNLAQRPAVNGPNVGMSFYILLWIFSHTLIGPLIAKVWLDCLHNLFTFITFEMDVLFCTVSSSALVKQLYLPDTFVDCTLLLVR